MPWLTNVDPTLARTWLPVAMSSEITAAPTRVWLLGSPYVACRLGERLTVLPDQCPHRLAPLSAGSVVDGNLQCAYHGWCFDADGLCTSIPSLGPGATLPPRARLTPPYGVAERYGLIFVALEKPVVDIIDIDGLTPSPTGRRTIKGFTGHFGAGLLIDNQLDISHFAFLHQNTFGTDAAAVTPPYAVQRDPDGWGFMVRSEIPISATNDPGTAAGVRPVQQYRIMTFRYRAPLQLSLLLEYPMMGVTHNIAFFAQPERAEAARLFSIGVMERDGGFSDEEYSMRAEFENRVGAEDRAMQATFDQLRLPLDLTTEVHVRADRASIEYRRILRCLVDLESGDTGADEVPLQHEEEEVGAC
jgi:phenylpropionate dioxygenase-like ring-hydroxylating dioxygenase large terminal subunit